MTLGEFKKELEDTAIRLEQYLETLELEPKNKSWVKNIGKEDPKYFEDGLGSYIQQRAKLTAYLYVLSRLGVGTIVDIIAQRRGTKLLDKKRGIVADTLAYKKLKKNSDQAKLWETLKL